MRDRSHLAAVALMAAGCRGEVTDAGRIQIPVLALNCGILACLVAGVIIFAQLACIGIRYEVRRRLTEMGFSPPQAAGS